MVFQRPCGTLVRNRRPRGPHPRSGAMLVLVQVSSMKTRRPGSIRLWRAVHCTRLRATSGRSCSLASTVFFEAQLLGMDEVPYRVVVDLQTTPGQLGHQPAQGEGLFPDPFHKPGMVLAPDRLRLVPAHLPRRHTPRPPVAPNPGDRRVDPNAEPRRRLAPRQTVLLNRSNNTLAKINRIRLCHPCWPPSPASMLNQIRPPKGIPNRISLMTSRSSMACSPGAW